MKIWNDCVEIYKEGEFTDNIDIDQSVFNSFRRYQNVILKEPQLNVWYDMKTGNCFGPEQDFYKNPGDFSFFAQKEDFLSNPKWGYEHVTNYLGESFGTDAKITTEFVIQNSQNFKKFEDKTILLIGGGPSTNDVDWKSMNLKYDYVWACNNFFMRSDADELDASLLSVGPTVDLECPEFNDYVRQHKTLCVFEGGISPFRKPEEFAKLKSSFPNQVAYFHLRYFSKVGTLARLICLATFLKAKKIYFVGMDGYPGKGGDKYEHAYEGVHKTDHQGRTFSYDLHRRQYVLLWDYLLNQIEDNKTEYQNLGEGHRANQSTDISKKEFSLQIP